MERQTEAEALTHVQERLAAKFPDMEEETVASAVRSAHGEMIGPIRDYVPVLVERLARDRLAHLHPPQPGAPT